MLNYSGYQKFLHDIILNNKFINNSLFELEKIFYLKKDIKKEKHIYITGLPRSGTTSLLNFLYSSKQFSSLKYLNMPFIQSPNISKIINKKKIKSKERLHADGIKYNLDSPESFEEVFFKNKKTYIHKEYLNYINLIANAEGRKRYLSKNNLNYKRVKLFQTILPNSIFFIMIRHPLYHAFSLLKKHELFCLMQKKEDFIRRYMNYLNHHEFGVDHLPWNSPKKYKDFSNINYWLEQWYFFYKKIYKKYYKNKKCYFVVYEKLTNFRYILEILKKAEIKKKKQYLNFFKNSNKKFSKKKIDKKLLSDAIKIYKKIK